MGNKKKKKRKNKLPAMYNKIYPILLIIATLFMGVGYAAIENISLNIAGDAIALGKDGMVIISAKPSYVSQMGTGSILSSEGTMFGSKVTLEENVNASMSYDITIYNNINDSTTYVFDGVIPDGYDPDFYSNKYIVYELNGLKVGDVINYKDSVTFTITFKYVNGVDFNVADFSNELTSYLQFNFGKYTFVSDGYGERQFTVSDSGYYLLEVWGASGYSYSDEYHGGYGGYSTGKVYLDAGTTLYIYTGGQGTGGQGGTAAEPVKYAGGFNGGAQARISDANVYGGGGGGATHIALSKGANENNGQLRDLENYLDDLLIVAGGGGSVFYDEGDNIILGGHGGGIEGSSGVNVVGNVNLATGGTQIAGGKQQGNGFDGKFGRGTSYNSVDGIGAGGGLWGGGSGMRTSAGGGSGYIGNQRLTDKHMSIYNEAAIASNLEDTKTNLVNSYSVSPIADTAKSGDGYARITFLGEETEHISILGKSYLITTSEPVLDQSTSATGEGGLYRRLTTSGKYTYYFRGDVNNNYVSFANMLWRIVRINEDGTIRLILQNGFADPAGASVFSPGSANYNYMYYSNTNVENGAMYKLENWYANNIGNNDAYASKVATNGNYFCEQAKVIGVGATAGNAMPSVVTNYVPSFSCETDANGKGIVNTAVGLITYDEIVFAGAVNGKENANQTYYLYNGELAWTMSPSGVGQTSQKAQVWRIDNLGNINSGDVDQNRTFRPVINLIKNVTFIGGDGSEGNPFVIG